MKTKEVALLILFVIMMNEALAQGARSPTDPQQPHWDEQRRKARAEGKTVDLFMAFSMRGGGQEWYGKYDPVEFFYTVQECRAAAKRYIDGSINSDVSSAYKKPDGTVFSYRHFRCVSDGVSVNVVGDDDNSLRNPSKAGAP